MTNPKFNLGQLICIDLDGTIFSSEIIRRLWDADNFAWVYYVRNLSCEIQEYEIYLR